MNAGERLRAPSPWRDTSAWGLGVQRPGAWSPPPSGPLGRWRFAARPPRYDQAVGKVHCSFCGRAWQPGELVTGREGARICQECVELANDALEQARLADAALSSAATAPSPHRS